MPLSSTGEAANCELYSNKVYFFMTMVAIAFAVALLILPLGS